MKRRYIAWILPVLLSGGLLLWGCSDIREGEVFAQPLMLATPAPSPADAEGSSPLPREIVVVLVTATPEQAASGQQDQDQQNQGPQNVEGQAVAQAQTPEGQQAPQAGNEQTEGGAGTGQAGDQELINMGEQIYMTNCASCHQPNGEGTSAYPALAGSEALTGEDATGSIEIVVNGRGQMPAFGDSLSAEQIAAVLSYERNAWGNSAAVVSADQVSQFQQGDGTQADGGAAQGDGSQEQGAPSPEAQAEQSGGSGEAAASDTQPTPAPADGQTQATPAPEGGSTEPAGEAATGQETPGGAVSQVSVSQEQGGMVITIRIELVLVTPEAGAAPAPQATPMPPAESPEGTEASPQPTDPGAEAQPAATAAGDGGEAAAGDTQATPAPEGDTQATQAPEDTQATPMPPAESSEGTDNGTTGAQGGEGAGMAESAEETAAAAGGDQELLDTGEFIYGTTCANCHQLSGQGNTAYPSLVNNETVIAEDPTAALLTILNGRGHMPAFAGDLSDQEVAAVLSHERNAWGNSASVVTAEQVAQVRGSGE